MTIKSLLVGTAAILAAFSFVTPALADMPYGTLFCQAVQSTVSSGELVNVSATYAGYGTFPNYQPFTWQAVGGTPSTGVGYAFATRFYTISISETRMITVSDGHQTASCAVTVRGISQTPTPVPTVNPVVTIVSRGGNITRGQNGEHTHLYASGGQTLDMFVHVRNTSTLPAHNVIVTEVLPSGLAVISHTTSLNDTLIADGISGTGVNIGTLLPGQESVVRFSVFVNAWAVPAHGQVTVQSTTWMRADGIASAWTQLPITLASPTSLATISRVKTGPADTILMATLIGMVASGLYAAYTGTAAFTRRAQLAELRLLATRGTPNFGR